MTRLCLVELRRLVARRFTWLALAGGVLLTLLLLYGVTQTLAPLTPASQAQAASEFQSYHQDWVDHHVEQEQSCLASLPESDRTGADAQQICAQPEPTLADLTGGPTSLVQVYTDTLKVALPMVLLVVFLLGASFVAAEFSTGAITSWLTFSPRRTQVFTSKLLAAAVGSAVITAIMMALFAVGTWWLGSRVDLTAQVSAQERTELVATLLRMLPIGIFGGLMGVALGFVLRHTAACLGVAVTYAVAVEAILSSTVPRLQPWTLSTNATGFVQHGYRYLTFVCSRGSGACTETRHWVPFSQSCFYLTVVTVVVVAGALVSFQRRDVT